MKAGAATEEAILDVLPFSLLSEAAKTKLSKSLQRYNFEIGERIIRSDEMPNYVYLIIKGEVRLLGEYENEGLITLAKRGVGQLIGWVSLLRGHACETVQASSQVKTIAIDSKLFVDLAKKEEKFRSYFWRTSTIQESWYVLSKNLEKHAYTPEKESNYYSRRARMYA